MNTVNVSYRTLASGCLLLLYGVMSGCSTPVSPISSSEPSQKIEKIQKKKIITIAAVGDLMLGTNFPTDRLAPKDGSNLLSQVSPYLSQADITFGNLEGVLLDGGEPAKKCKNLQACYVFRSPSVYADHFKTAGFDVMSLANNHARDFGEDGRTSSMEALAVVGIHHTGRINDIASWEVENIKIAFIAYAPFGGSFDLLDIPLAQKQVEALAATHDIVVVSMHAGAEGAGVERVPFAREMFHGENRGDVVAFSHAVVDAGADLVLGHGPHVPRALELYKNRLIAYSLGNFCTYYGIRITGNNGLAPILQSNLSSDGEFLSGRIISTKQTRPVGNVLDSSHRAAKLIADLTRLDFPGTNLSISPQGEISIKTTPSENRLLNR